MVNKGRFFILFFYCHCCILTATHVSAVRTPEKKKPAPLCWFVLDLPKLSPYLKIINKKDDISGSAASILILGVLNCCDSVSGAQCCIGGVSVYKADTLSPKLYTETACIVDYAVLPLEGQQAPGDFGVSLDLCSPPLNDLTEQLVCCIPGRRAFSAISRCKGNVQQENKQRRR